ncbi:hypothetical protein BB559_005017 [Furculomyces boomerangus]|uniref:t-SNARE coiled-coil homology domain-containing protein n=1 Tax=Furculomyces boomerangus TaxID=61424 RepID=A0A2T9YBC5_9FUNG|nr:hypothetical protein BB559_005017 [Furculomyces boomerangus]
MARDRYQELRAVRKESNADVLVEEVGERTKEKTDMENFYTRISEVDDRIDKVNELVPKIQKLYEKNLTSINPEKEKEYTTEIDRNVMEANNELNSIRRRLLEIENENNKPGFSSGDQAVRRGRHAALLRKFTETIENYRSVERDSQMRYKTRIERQIKIVNPNATDEEISRAIEEGNARTVFQQSVLKSERTAKAKKTLDLVETRNKDIKNIEKTITELNNMFLEVQDMVNRQQEMLDNIENAVQTTEQYTFRANEDIEQAIVYRKSSRKKLWIILFILLMLIVAIVLIIYFTVIRK